MCVSCECQMKSEEERDGGPGGGGGGDTPKRAMFYNMCISAFCS